jgi:hypothetical protein
MLTAVVLICALGATCDLDHNVGRIPVPGEHGTPYACARAAEIEAARPENFGKILPGAYPRIVCMRWRRQDQW